MWSCWNWPKTTSEVGPDANFKKTLQSWKISIIFECNFLLYYGRSHGFYFLSWRFNSRRIQNKSSFIGPMLACCKNGRRIFLWQAKIETLNWIFLRCQHEHMYVLADFKRTQGVLTEKQKTSMWSCWHLEIFHSEKGIKWLHVWFQAMINRQANMITWMSYVFLIEHHLWLFRKQKTSMWSCWNWPKTTSEVGPDANF